jgi:outer membrane protein OmpU
MVAFAGVASAQSTSITLTGSAEMGLTGGNAADTQFFQDLDVTFALRGETDNGLKFGANVDLDEVAVDSCTSTTTTTSPATTTQSGGAGTDADGDNTFTTTVTSTSTSTTSCTDNALGNNAHHGGTTVFIGGDWGTLTMGDTDGAMDWALTEAGNVANPGSIADDETSHAGYVGSYLDGKGDGQILSYTNTFGAVGVAVSVEQGGNGASDTGYAVGLKYALDLGGSKVNLGVAHQAAAVNDNQTATGISASGTFGAFSAGVVYVAYDGNPTVSSVANVDNSYGIGLGYASGPIALHVNYGRVEGTTTADGYGIAAGYDLGGGAAVRLGWNDNAAGANWSLGVAMSF